ncbi:molybdopterin-dependent oxidoreductase [Nocardia asteroides]|uniref:molybdopterin-dependent oxidoreductase n=1 Tax=Nocardia asteroides TaxID=1824 RepID=UPI001E58A296|nr:molybdopterin-dependent oxidoreductase [Nocardia asteroides]UGT64194.1 molybdopterin-dependent oxidoreductase [Nocardia asteroides]
MIVRAAAGVAAGIVTLGTAELLAGVLEPAASPLRLLGDAVVDHAPRGPREWAIETFGTADKIVLVVAVLVVAVLVSAVAGVLGRAGAAVFAVFGVGVVALAVAEAGVFAAVPTVVGVAAGMWVLLRAVDGSRAGSATRRGTGMSEQVADAGVNRAAADTRPRERMGDVAGRAGDDAASAGGESPSVGSAATSAGREAGGAERRRVLRGLALATSAGIAAGLAGRALAALRTDVSGERAGIALPPAREPLPETPFGADLRTPGITPYLTPNAEFYRIDTAITVPQVSIEDWSLRIHGMVEREIILRWGDLASRPAVERLTTLACVSNPVGGDLIGNARWLGYRLDALLAEARPLAGADMVLSRSVDGWTAGSPLGALTDGRDALLAIGMNGEPLPVAHGYPARLVVPGLYGYVSATKWVTELEVTRFDRATAYWTKLGWAAEGPIKTGTRIDTPAASARLKPGRISVAGVAWAQHRGIAAVEVQVDDGPWGQARLAADVSVDTWRQWVYEWDATPGPHTLRARATDGAGAVQTAEVAAAVPDGASGYPAVFVRVG